MGIVLSGILFEYKSFFAHLTPRRAPDALRPALVIIETLRILIRPLTLSFRLAANMTAGHIVLTLISSYLRYYVFETSGLVLSLLLAGYTLFEVGICIIQAYIFTLLLTLYADEHPHYVTSSVSFS